MSGITRIVEASPQCRRVACHPPTAVKSALRVMRALTHRPFERLAQSSNAAFSRIDIDTTDDAPYLIEVQVMPRHRTSGVSPTSTDALSIGARHPRCHTNALTHCTSLSITHVCIHSYSFHTRTHCRIDPALRGRCRAPACTLMMRNSLSMKRVRSLAHLSLIRFYAIVNLPAKLAPLWRCTSSERTRRPRSSTDSNSTDPMYSIV
jgi:hypothetical protein